MEKRTKAISALSSFSGEEREEAFAKIKELMDASEPLIPYNVSFGL